MGRSSRRGPRLTKKDTGILTTSAVVLIFFSGMCWHYATATHISFHNYDGVVVAKATRLPSGKQMYPVGRDIVIEESDGTRETIAVSEAVYRQARPGMKFHRDRFGNTTVE